MAVEHLLAGASDQDTSRQESPADSAHDRPDCLGAVSDAPDQDSPGARKKFFRSLVITSPNPQEGKTVTAVIWR